MVKISEYYFDSNDAKHQIHVTKWQPDAVFPKGILQISHGIGEHIGHYKEFAAFMAKNGFIVVGNDHLGHGKSFSNKDDRGFFAEKNGWKTVCADMHKLYDIEHSASPSLPYFLLGHSMGSFLARTYLILYPDGLSGCMLTGTGQQSPAACLLGQALTGFLSVFMGRRGKSSLMNSICFGTYNINFKPHRTQYDWVSSSRKEVDDLIKSDKSSFIPTLSLLSDMFGGISFIQKRKNLKKMDKNLPIYFFSGERDPVGGKGKGVKKAYDSFLSVGCTDVTLKLYETGRHEMLHEKNKDEVFKDVCSWVEQKMK